MNRKRIVALCAFIIVLSVAACLSACSPNFVLTFESNGGTACDKLVVANDAGEFKLPAPTREGYEFEGWFVDEELARELTDEYIAENGVSNLTLYAKWSAVTKYYIVAFTSDIDGAALCKEQVVPYGGAAELPQAPDYEGYVFVGWSTNAYTHVTDHLNVKALYSVKKFEFKCYINGELRKEETLYYGVDVEELPIVDRLRDYEFLGWYASPDFEEETRVEAPLEVRGDITLYAKLEPRKFPIYYNNIEGVSNAADFEGEAYFSAFDTVVTLVRPQMENKIFLGWYPNSELKGNPLPMTFAAESFNFREQMKLYAKWGDARYVRFYVDDELYETETLLKGAPITQPQSNPTAEGREFLYWSLTPNGDEYEFGASAEENVRLYAVWESVPAEETTEPTETQEPTEPIDPSDQTEV